MSKVEGGIYSYFYTGDGHPFYVKVGYSKNIKRRMKEHKMSNPLIEEGPTIKVVLADFANEFNLHRIFKDLFEEISPEHYKLTVEDRLDFDKIFSLAENTLDKKWEDFKKEYVI